MHTHVSPAGQRHLVDIPPDVAYFNCAFTSPLLKAGEAAGRAALRAKAQPWTLGPSDFFTHLEHCRELFGEIMRVNAEHVAIIPAASYGLAIAARNLPLPAGKAVIVLEDQFPSNVYCWRTKARQCGGEIKTVPYPADDDWTSAVLAQLNADVAIAALPPCHWTDGMLVDLVAIGARCREVGAALVVDATQAMGAMPLDLAAIGADFVVTASHKWLFGAYGAGFCVVHEKWLHGEPLEENWLNRKGIDDFSRLTQYEDQFRGGARAFDMGGASSFFNMPVVAAGLEQVRDWGMEAIAANNASILEQIVTAAEQLGFRAPAKAARAPHMTGLRSEALPQGVSKALAEQKVYVSVRGSCVRIAPHMHITQVDVDRLIGALEQAVRA